MAADRALRPLPHTHTALNEFSICERRAFYRFVLGEDEGPSYYRSLGILYHELLAAIATADLWVPEQGMAIVSAHLRRRDWQSPPGATPETLMAELSGNIARVQAEILRHLPPHMVAGVPQIEVSVAQAAIAASGVTMHGRIDYIAAQTPMLDKAGAITGVEDGPCVLDWKVKFNNKNRRTQFATETSAQLAGYCILANVHRAGFVEIPRSLNEPLGIHIARFDDADLRRWRAYFREQFAATDSRGLEERNYKLAAPGHPLCCPKFCPHWRRCPGGEAC